MAPLKGFVLGNLIAGPVMLVMGVLSRSWIVLAFGLAITGMAVACWAQLRRRASTAWLDDSLAQPQHDYDADGHVIPWDG